MTSWGRRSRRFPTSLPRCARRRSRVMSLCCVFGLHASCVRPCPAAAASWRGRGAARAQKSISLGRALSHAARRASRRSSVIHGTSPKAAFRAARDAARVTLRHPSTHHGQRSPRRPSGRRPPRRLPRRRRAPRAGAGAGWGLGGFFAPRRPLATAVGLTAGAVILASRHAAGALPPLRAARRGGRAAAGRGPAVK